MIFSEKFSRIILIFTLLLPATLLTIEENSQAYTQRRNYLTSYHGSALNEVSSALLTNLTNECTIDTDRKQNCLPFDDASESLCLKVNCCWRKQFANSAKFPNCYFPKNTVRYAVSNIQRTRWKINASLSLVNPSGLPGDIQHLTVNVAFCGTNMIRLKITDASKKRYEVPLPLLSSCTPSYWNKLYDVIFFPNGTFIIKRLSSDNTIFSTDFSTLIYADQILQLSSALPSHHVYGLGDHMGPLHRSTNWTIFTFFNRDQIPERQWNLYSSFPFYLSMEKDGNSNGVYLFNSNAMDIILQPQPAVTFRTVGGVLDFFIFLGPSPNEVIQQFTKLVGYPAMPPYWSLGFHLSRLGYFNLTKTIEVWNRTRNAGIFFDVQWNDIDYMDNYNDFTYDEENFKHLPDFVDQLHKVGMHYVMIIDPGISSAEKPGTYGPYDDGLAMDIFVKNSSGQLLETKVWNKISSVFPDFSHPLATTYWTKQLSRFYSTIKFDGIWLDMNEPTNFLNGSFDGCPKDSSFENTPYTPGNDHLCTKTICMTAKHNVSLHYNIHNIYGTLETETTFRALIKILKSIFGIKRPFILTRGGFPGIGRYAAMWNGDVLSTWDHMKASIPSILTFSMAGVSSIGADICGFNDNTTVELCARWFQLGAFYPFCRNHNSDENIEQDPVALGPIVTKAAKTALYVRYSLLPYLYTLMYFSHVRGDTVARPIFFEYPHDINTYKIDKQFLWGPALMIIPALEPNVIKISGYFPSDAWYDFFSGEKLPGKGGNFSFDAPMDKVNLFVRGGYIIPSQEPNQTTTSSRYNAFHLTVALDDNKEANGTLYIDDGETLDTVHKKWYNLIQFNATNNSLTTTATYLGYPTEMILEKVRIFNIDYLPNNVYVNGNISKFAYDATLKTLTISSLDVTLLDPLTINWY